MKRRQLLRNLIEEFNRRKLRYCILRNYEFLLDPREKPGFDLDISIAAADREEAERVLHSNGFIRKPKQFSLRHRGYRSFSTEEMASIGIDVQWDGVVWNDIPYLSSRIYLRRKKQGWLFTLSDEDAFVMYLCHSLLGKRFFKEKYWRKLQELAAQELGFSAIAEHLGLLFRNWRLGAELVALVRAGRQEKLLRLRRPLILRFIGRRNLPRFALLFFRWVWEKKVPHAYPLVAFIGPDGAGKSTMVEAIKSLLEKNRRSVSVVYLGRGKGNLLPLAAPGKAIKQRLAARPLWLKKLVSTLAAPLYTLDLLLRYALDVIPHRLRSVTLTDRYATDIFLTPHLGTGMRSLLFRLFPKPALTFYLFNDVETLHARKRHPLEELRQQLALFESLAAQLDAVRVRTDSRKSAVQLVASRVFRHLAEKGL